MEISKYCSRFYVSDITPYFFDLASDLKYASNLVKYNFVRSQTIELARQSLNDKHASENHKLDLLFRIGFEFAGNVLNNYWLLRASLREQVEKYAKREFKNSYVIGMQIRWLHGYLEENDVEIFANCAHTIELEKSDIIGNRSVKWYVSTDEVELIEKLRGAKYNKTILSGLGKLAAWRNPDGNERLLFDIEMLSRSDDVVITGGSTFGFIGVMKSQKMPYFVEGGRSVEKCEKFRFSRPPRTPAGAAIF
jgi:hypothetical protein